MPETLSMRHFSGPTGLEVYLNSQQGDLGTGTRFLTTIINRVDPSQITTAGAGIPIPILTAITGSTSGQTINIATTQFIDGTATDYWIIEGGTANQEVVHIGSIVDATHCTCICRKNHAVNTTMQKLFSSFSKYLSTQTDSLPSPNGIGNVCVVRYGDLPANVFDLYAVRGTTSSSTYVEDDSIPLASTGSLQFEPVPQYDPTQVSSQGNPTNGLVINAGPLTFGGVGSIDPAITIQILFATLPEPFTSFIYRVYWDDL